MRGNPTAVRWGDRRRIVVPAMTTVSEVQFVDLDLEAPRELLVSLSAVAAPPMAGLSVTWKLYWGAGAAMVVEPLTVPVDDEAAPVPLVLRRSASKLRVTCLVGSTIAGIPRDVVVSAFAGPVVP